jgi:hypothetical protein
MIRFPSFLYSMEVNMSASVSRELFVDCLNKVPDPRSQQGVLYQFRTILALVFHGLFGNITEVD